VGAGFSDAVLAELAGRLAALRRPEPPCGGKLPRSARHLWCEPRLVCEVRYLELTEDGMLRQPLFVRLRDDKLPEDCAREGAEPAASSPPPPPPPPPVEKKIAFTNLDKVFWPEDGYTKGDLVAYYRDVAPWLLPYLRDRPVVMTRYPDGIHGKSFFQKDAPGFAPGWLRTERIWSEHAAREIDYFVCEDAESLQYLANMGTIPLHVWASRVTDLARPDWCILDLDPKGAPLADVVRIARALRALCDEIELPSFVKTSGQAGLHVLVPLGGACTFEECKGLGELLARVVAGELPQIATVARAIPARGGRVYVDFLQNGHGKLLVAPLSVRPVAGAPVSMPLAWGEVTARLDPGRYTIRTALKKLEKGGDPMRGVLEARPDLPAALALLAERLARRGRG
jgi:bifunctional non-homologous end joining protein LigD